MREGLFPLLPIIYVHVDHKKVRSLSGGNADTRNKPIPLPHLIDIPGICGGILEPMRGTGFLIQLAGEHGDSLRGS
jgi:hypothetical protein